MDKKHAHFDSICLQKSVLFESRLARRADPSASVNIRKQLKSRIKASRRRQALWLPKLKKLKLTGVRVLAAGGSGEAADLVVSDPPLVQKELIAAWGPVYAQKETDVKSCWPEL